MKRKTLKAKSLGCALKKRAASGTAAGLFIALAVLWTGCPNPNNKGGGNSGTEDTVVNDLNLSSAVIAPVKNTAPATTGIDKTQYTGTIEWQTAEGTALPSGAKFGYEAVYKAVVTLTAKSGYTFTGFAGSFTYADATTVTGEAGENGTWVVTITFQATEAAGGEDPQITAVEPSGGPLTFGTGGALAYAVTTSNIDDGAAATVTWSAGDAPEGVAISGALTVSDNAVTITITSTAATPAGEYSFIITVSGVPSALQTFTVNALEIDALEITTLAAPAAPFAPAPLPALALTATIDNEHTSVQSLTWKVDSNEVTGNVDYATTYTAVLVVEAAQNYTFDPELDEGDITYTDAEEIEVYVDGNTLTITLTFAQTIAAPHISLENQGSAVTSGDEGSTTYTVTVTSIADATYDAPTLAWYSDQEGQNAKTVDGVTAESLVIGSETGTLTLRTTSATAPGNHYFKVTFAGITSGVKVLTVSAADANPLNPVTSVAIGADGVITWTDAQDHVDHYSVQLYNAADDSAVGDPFTGVSGTTEVVTKLQAHNTVGEYYVKVTAIGDQINTTDSEESAASDTFTVAAYSASFVYTAGSDTAGTLTLTFNAEVSGLVEGNISIDSGGTLTGESFNATGAPDYTVGVTGVAGNTPIQVTVTAPDYYAIQTASKQAAMPEWVDYVSAAVSPAVAGGNFDETTSAIVITFSAEIDTLAASNITLTPGDTGAAKNDELAHTGGTVVYTLPVTGITQGGTVGLSFTDPEGYHIGGAAEASVAVKYFAVVSDTDLELDDRVTAPVQNAAPDTRFSAPASYNGVITWYEENKTTEAPANFAAGTVYAAKITLTVQSGYTLAGLASSAFTYAGDSKVTYADGIVWISFPPTANTSVTVTFVVGDANDLTYGNPSASLDGASISRKGAATVTVAFPTTGYTDRVWYLDDRSPTSLSSASISLWPTQIPIGWHTIRFEGTGTGDGGTVEGRLYTKTVSFQITE